MVAGMKRRLSGVRGIKRYGWAFFLVGNAILAVVAAMLYAKVQPAMLTTSPMPTPSATPTPSAIPSPEPPSFEEIYNLYPNVGTAHWVSWALVDNASGILAGSENWAQPSYVMSMIKPWIAADYFNQHLQGVDSATQNRLASMILDSNDQVAYQYFSGKPSLDRLIETCGLTDMVERPWSWSLTQMSARDAALMGFCIYSGKATRPEWTTWIVDKMRHVRGDGDFGPRELVSDRTQVATKNGWYNWEGKWYINCLAITDKWTISILQQWPYAGGSLKYGISLANPTCKSVANQVLRLNSL